MNILKGEKSLRTFMEKHGIPSGDLHSNKQCGFRLAMAIKNDRFKGVEKEKAIRFVELVGKL